MTIAPRLSKVGKFGITLAAIAVTLAGIYIAAGFFLVPYLVHTQVLSGISKTIDAELSAERVAIDPFEFTITVSGLSLKDRAGRELAACRELTAGLKGRESLAERRLILAGRLVEPTVRPELDARGRLNFAALAPRGNSGGGLPFLVTRFAVEGGRIEFKDASHGKPYAVVWDGVSATLENFAPGPDQKAAFHIAARGDHREFLSIEGRLSLSPWVSEGTLELSELDAAPWLDRLAPDLPWRARSGKLGGKARYFLSAGAKTRFEIGAGEVRGEGLELSAPGGGDFWVKLGSVSTEGVFFSLAERRLKVDSWEIREAASPWLKVAAVGAGLSYDIPEQRLKADSAVIIDARSPGSPESELTGPANPASADPAEGKAGENSLQAAGTELRPARIGQLRILNLDGSLKQRSLAIESAASDRAELDVRRLPGGSLQVPGLPALPLGTLDRDAAAPSWHFRIADVRLDGYSVRFWDETVEPPVKLNFTPVTLQVKDFSTEQGSLFTYRLDTRIGERGKIEVDGQARLAPLQADLRFGVDKLWLRSIQPYWQQLTGIDLVRGRLNLWGDITVLGDPELRLDYSGGADIVDLATVDRRERKDFIRWKSLKFDGLVVNTRPRRVSIRTLSAEHAHARVFIAADGELNLLKDLIPVGSGTRPSQGPPRKEHEGERWPVVIGALRVVDGGMDFTDLTLRPSFAVDIRSLNGNVRGLSSQEKAKAELFLEGRLNHNSPVRIFGRISPFSFRDHTDVTLAFRGVNLTTLSPYSGKFAGYRIEKGKLDMDIRYRLHDRVLEAENRMVLDQLVLGERVDSPNATTLPVDLAVALLKDSEGKIDIDLPVSGSLDDPKFSLRSLYSNALTQLFAKLVSSPFALLGNLVSGGSEELDYVKFQPGDASLGPDEKTRLSKVAGVLRRRLGLNLDIKSFADPWQDRLALADKALAKHLKESLAAERRALGIWTRGPEGPELSDADYRRLFTHYYQQHYPDSPEIRALAGQGQPVLNGASLERAKHRVLEQWRVNELELRLLAQARGESIRDYLVREGGLPDRRIYLLDVKLASPGDREIKAFLNLSAS